MFCVFNFKIKLFNSYYTIIVLRVYVNNLLVKIIIEIIRYIYFSDIYY